MKLKKIIYTGSTGSLGSNMPRNSEIVPIFIKLQNTEMSIYKEINKHKADMIIHFAAVIDKKKCENQKKYCYNINVIGSKKLFNASIKANIKRFIYVSTSEVYGTSKKLIYKNINSKTQPENTYGELKLEAEKALANIAKENPKIKLSIARVFSVSSNYIRKGSLEEKIHKLAKKQKIEFIKGLNKIRDFSLSTKICKDLIRLSKSKSYPKIVNICSEKPVKLLDFVCNIYKKYDLNFKIKYHYKIPKTGNYLIGKKTKF